MLTNISNYKYPIAILMVVFIIFLLNGIGALEIRYRTGIDININSHLLAYTLTNTIIHPFNLVSLNLIVMLATGLILSVSLPLLTPAYAAILTVVSSIPHLLIYIYTTNMQLILPMEFSLLIILILFSMNALISYFIETHTRQQIITLFGQYIPTEIVSEICKQPDLINMDGESRQMTVLFCDLQDFTSFSELLDPKQVTQLLNEYFDAMTEILYSHGATIDKYIGDSIMSFWGAPVTQEDHAERAIFAAFDMHKKMKFVSENFTLRGLPPTPMGIGINSGTMNVGNMGSKYRIVYTVIGDAVNLASRLEALTRIYKIPILVSESTMNECKNIVFREVDNVQVKGKQKFTRIYHPICRQSDKSEKMEALLRRHHEGIEAYNMQDFDSATRIFRSLQKDVNDDEYYPAILKKISNL